MISRELVRQTLRDDEGLRLRMYQDTVGRWTVGYGRNIQDRGIRVSEAELMLDNDIDEAEREAHSIPFFWDLTDVRQGLLVMLVFNMGLSKLHEFKKFLAAAEARNHIEAANELRASKWFQQVGARGDRIARAWLCGVWQ